MQVSDLGEIDGDILVFGGPYSNLQATNALIREAKLRRIPPERCICTGDVVAYCADAAATVEAVRDFGCHVIAGNCEVQLAAGAEDCGCGFEEGTTCDLLSVAWYTHANTQITPDQRAWMAALPDVATFTCDGKRYAVLHGGFTDVSRFLWPSSHLSEFQEEFAALEAVIGRVDTVLSGHSGIPFVRHAGDRLWINAGAIGMPPHDARPDTRFAVLSKHDVSIQKLSYNHAAAARVMEGANLTQGYHQTLITGIWPSEDVLPKVLRR